MNFDLSDDKGIIVKSNRSESNIVIDFLIGNDLDVVGIYF